MTMTTKTTPINASPTSTNLNTMSNNTKKQRNIYVVGASDNYANWMEGTIVRDMFSADLVVFTGGEDVCPRLYNQPAHPKSSFNIRRDKEELHEFEQAVAAKKPMIGICRGSQFLCVMAGGILVQHSQHPSFHNIDTFTEDVINVTSSHHQRQYPFHMKLEEDYKLLGWTVGLSPVMEGDGLALPDGSLPELASAEVEIAYYPKINALAIQSHPEWDMSSVKSTAYFRALLDKHLSGGL
jgi:gamma-glutamyl-gamma-aminobutyrate hydrolase PuuD